MAAPLGARDNVKKAIQKLGRYLFALALLCECSLAVFAVPPPPISMHHTPPYQRTIATTIYCVGGTSSILLKQSITGQFVVLDLVWRGHRLREDLVRQADARLHKLSHVADVIGMCGERNDILYATGVSASTPSNVGILFNDHVVDLAS